jgi:hypothetical protein
LIDRGDHHSLASFPGDPADVLLREAAQERPTAAELNRVRARLDVRIAARKVGISRVMTLGVPLAAGLAVAIPTWRSMYERSARAAAASEFQHPAPQPLEPSPAPMVETPPPLLVEPEPIPAPAAIVTAPAPSKHSHRSVARPAPYHEDSLSDETQRLFAAISLLRREANPAGALKEIDAYRRSYPQPHFATEARMLRIEALVALGYRHQALDELSVDAIPSLPRGEELWVLRGEILVQLKRPREAIDAFDAALRVARTDALIERALSGRATAQRDLPK